VFRVHLAVLKRIRWVNGVRSASGAYIHLTLKMIFFFKAFRKFPRHRRFRNNEVGQNDCIYEIWGTVKIPLCSIINPRCPNTKTYHY
jgi:hypothetical protein